MFPMIVKALRLSTCQGGERIECMTDKGLPASTTVESFKELELGLATYLLAWHYDLGLETNKSLGLDLKPVIGPIY
jgi:hypothetical protein